MQTKMDHLVIGANDLEQGVAYVEETLGVSIPPGGVHEQLGTHNHLMSLGDSLFLEVIAINPQGSDPGRPRWFGLDDPHIRNTLRKQPALLTWVAQCDDLAATLERAAQPWGEITPISRGQLNWLFALPEDGRLLGGGMLPYLMQWQVTPHPAGQMKDLGCRLKKLVIHHPYVNWLNDQLSSIGAEQLVQLESLDRDAAPFLEAQLETPTGPRVITNAVKGKGP